VTPAEAAPIGPGPWRCAADPSVETYLRCGRCDKPICPRCLIQTPVGARCRECARLRRLPMFVLGPLDYLKALGGALGAGIGGAVVLTLLLSMVPRVGFLGIILMAGLGYVVGEAVSLATRRKRGNILGVIAALGVIFGLIAAHAGLFILGGAQPLVAFAAASASLVLSIWNLLGLAVAAVIAFSRAR
jgi:hypothetical protein